MRELLSLLVLVAGCAPCVRGTCTVSGVPAVMALKSKVVLTQNNDLWKQGFVQWDVTAERNDTQIYTWLQWSSVPTGQGCSVSFTGYTNDTCNGRVKSQFQQSSAYNSGVLAADSAQGNAAYPLACAVQLNFHAFDQNGVPNPNYNPSITDPSDPRSMPVLPDPGFDFSSVVQLTVTANQFIPEGGNPGTPPGVTRDGACPLPEANEVLPAYMFSGPGCAGPAKNALAMVANSNGTGASVSLSLSAVVQNTLARRESISAQIRAALDSNLRAALAAATVRTQFRNGRPRIVQKQPSEH
jgi:hypothetical protein